MKEPLDDEDLPGEPTKDEKIEKFFRIYHRTVNHPTRKRILEIISGKPSDKREISRILIDEGLIKEEKETTYHLNLLLDGKCVERDGGEDGKFRLTQAGELVDYLKR